MRIKSILFLLVCFLLSCSFTLPLLACECDPACEGCESCEAGVCVDDPDNCISCQNCVDAKCVDDDDLCDGCETCSNGYCDDDDGECAIFGPCKSCVDAVCEDDDSKCDPDECCVDGECIDPQCDNCHMTTDTLYECGHEEISTNCDTSYCMKSILDTATCDRHDDPWPCDKRNCDTAPDGSAPLMVQTTYLLTGTCPTGGDPVVYTHWVTVNHGCGSSCWGNTFMKACQIDTCVGSSMGEPSFIGQKKKCGCP